MVIDKDPHKPEQLTQQMVVLLHIQEFHLIFDVPNETATRNHGDLINDNKFNFCRLILQCSLLAIIKWI